MKQRAETRVAVICGGISDEAYLSRRSAGVVRPALEEAGYAVETLDWCIDVVIGTRDGAEFGRWPDLVRCLGDHKPDVLFNATHGERENAGQLHGLAELAGVPLTGNALAPSVLGMDKILSRNEFTRLGIRHPRAVAVPPEARADAEACNALLESAGLSFPVMTKLALGGSSAGLEYSRSMSDLLDTMAGWGNRGPVFLEEFIGGREFCVTTFGASDDELTVFPVVEIGFAGPVFDKETKFNDRYTVSLPDDLDSAAEEEMRKWARMLHTTLGFTAFSRFDYRIGAEGPYALEVNTHPGLSPSSIVTNSLQYTDLSMVTIVDRLVRYSLAADR